MPSAVTVVSRGSSRSDAPPRAERRRDQRVRLSGMLFAGCLLSSQAIVAHGQHTVTGVVRDSLSGLVIPNVDLVVPTLNRRAVTNDFGRYSLLAVRPGAYLLLIRAVGYRPLSATIEVTDAAVTEFDFALVPQGVRLDSVLVTSRLPFQGPETPMRRFEDRRRMGFGRFVDSSSLRELEHLNLASALRQRGIEILRNNAMGRNPSGGRCLLHRYLDGYRLPHPPPPLDDLRSYAVSSLAAVEAYTSVSSTPTEFRRPDQNCGVLLMWTRR